MKTFIRSPRIGLLILLAAVPVCALASLAVGAAGIPLPVLIRNLSHSVLSVEHEILFRIRLPRIVLAIAAGGALSVSGVLLQGLFRNPLVAPYTLGISGGAALGVALAIVLGLANTFAFSLPIAGFTGALCVMGIIYGLNAARRIKDVQGMLLIGVMISFMATSLFMLVMAMSRSEDLHGIVFWIMGSLDEPDIRLVYGLAVVSLIGLGAAYLFIRELNAMALGEQDAHHLGIDVHKARKRLFLLASILTGITVAVTGVIGFVGLVVPHFVRLFFGSDHRYVLAGAYMGGAVFLLACDALARTIISPLEMPIGVITGLVGGALFISALARKRLGVG
ncbi:iron ABC transporter permease [bacterium]|nr:iron ABC transporter permease [bacterium]